MTSFSAANKYTIITLHGCLGPPLSPYGRGGEGERRRGKARAHLPRERFITKVRKEKGPCHIGQWRPSGIARLPDANIGDVREFPIVAPRASRHFLALILRRMISPACHRLFFFDLRGISIYKAVANSFSTAAPRHGTPATTPLCL